jgi:hypothetical protein
MEPPVAIKDYAKLSKKLAKTHFNWFISQVPSRIDQLKEFTRIGKEKSTWSCYTTCG